MHTPVISNPPDNAQIRCLTEEEARLKAVGGGFAEIGIASFMDTWHIAREEKTSFTKRLPLREGKRGRPRKTKRIGKERQLRVDDGGRDLEGSDRLDEDLLAETLAGMVAAEIKAGEPFDEVVEEDEEE